MSSYDRDDDGLIEITGTLRNWSRWIWTWNDNGIVDGSRFIDGPGDQAAYADRSCLEGR